MQGAGYLAVLFEDPAEAERALRGLREQGMPADDLRLYDGEETLRIASRLQQERSRLVKAINEVVVDRALRERWLAMLGPVGRCCGSMLAARIVPTGWWGLLADYRYGTLRHFGEGGVEDIEGTVR